MYNSLSDEARAFMNNEYTPEEKARRAKVNTKRSKIKDAYKKAGSSHLNKLKLKRNVALGVAGLTGAGMLVLGAKKLHAKANEGK